MLRTALPTLLLLLLVSFASSMADEAKALGRLMNVIIALEHIGDEMVGEPVCGTAAVGDTTQIELMLYSEYMYHIHIWSDSYFNYMEFWLTDSRGEMHSIADGDNTSLAAYPDTTGRWTLTILLHEGAYSDSASYAAAIFRNKRYL